MARFDNSGDGYHFLGSCLRSIFSTYRYLSGIRGYFGHDDGDLYTGPQILRSIPGMGWGASDHQRDVRRDDLDLGDPVLGGEGIDMEGALIPSECFMKNFVKSAE